MRAPDTRWPGQGERRSNRKCSEYREVQANLQVQALCWAPTTATLEVQVYGRCAHIVKTEQQHGEPSRRDPPCTCTTVPETKEGSSPDLSEASLVASVSTKPLLPSLRLISMFLCAVSVAPPALVTMEPWKARGSIVRPSMISFAPVVDLTDDGLDVRLQPTPAPSPAQSRSFRSHE